MMQRLQGAVAVVTGASRGAGRAIAVELGRAGATVYVTGRTTRETASTAGRRETIEETAERVTAAGGKGVAMRVDHAVEADIQALFDRIQAEQGRVDLLVNNAWGGYEGYDQSFVDPFWVQPLSRFDRMWTAGVRSHIATTRLALPLMLPHGKGLVINTTSPVDGSSEMDRFNGNVYYDTAKTALNRMSFGMAHNLRSHGVAVIALAPGWMRTEATLEIFNTDERSWSAIEALKGTESPYYIARAVAALAQDSEVMRRTGRVEQVGDLAREYGFTDLDGRWIPPFKAS